MNDKENKIHLGGTARSPEDVMALHRLGLRFAEIPIEGPEYFSALLKDYRAVKNETGMVYLCHGPREGDPNDVHTLESVYLPKLTEIISLMPLLEMRLLTFHLWLDPRFLKKETIEYKVDFLKRLTASAQHAGIVACLENLSERADHLARAFSAAPLLRMTLDLGHAELLCTRNTSYDFFATYPDRIQHIHLHDNRGGKSSDDDLHLPVGQGAIDFASIFSALRDANYTGTITLELKPREIEECLDHVRNLLR